MTVIHNYWNKWLNRRIPAATQHHLNHHNIFIFPAKFGLLFLSLCVLLFLLGTNYQNNLMLLLCYFLLAMFLVNLLASYINFASIDLQIGKCSEVFVGDNLDVPIWLNANNDAASPTHGLLHFKFQATQCKSNKKAKTQHKKSGTLVDADAFTNPISLSQNCQQRGKLTLSRVTVESFYPLGLYRCWTHLAFSHEITVFPKPLPCDIKLHISQKNNTKNSGDTANQQTGHDDFSHLKAYQIGEPLNHVAWKQLAKGRGMVSKQFSSIGNHIGWLKLSAKYKNKVISQPSIELETTLDKVLLDKKALDKRALNNIALNNTALNKELGELCYQVIELSRAQRTFGLDLGARCIAPNRGAEHRLACLKALAYFPKIGC
ncbi:MAG: hypothetical protein ACI9LE_001538 [Paraglaciecola sp.]|jgi:uncharacterized protein (DUF58 family)